MNLTSKVLLIIFGVAILSMGLMLSANAKEYNAKPNILFVKTISTVWMWDDYTISVKALNSYWKPLPYANITITVDGLDDMMGTTTKTGVLNESFMVRSYEFDNHALYNGTVTMEYYGERTVENFSFWTISRGT